MQTFLNVLTIVAFFLSTYTFISDLLTKRKKVDINLLQVAQGYKGKYQSYSFCLQILNRSRLPISVSNIQIKANDRIFDILNLPIDVFFAKVKDNGELIGTKRIPAAVFPANLQSLGGERLYFLSYKESDFQLYPGKEITFILYTNRGKIEKTAITPDLCDVIDMYPETLPENK